MGSEEHPCYGMQDILGCGENKEIKMLCSECNTGEWHNEFEKREATDEEKLYASYSKYNMCTYYDHPEELFTNDPDSDYSLRMYTEEEIAENKRRKEIVGTTLGLGSMFGANLNFLNRCSTTNSKALRTEEESNRYKQLADYKRALKLAKKTKNLEAVAAITEVINNIKNKG